MATEVARASSIGLGRAGRPGLILRRRINFVAVVWLAAMAVSSAPTAYGQKRREAILRLRDDVSTAIARSSLTQKQTQKLDRCRATLLVAAQSGRARHVAPEGDLHGALKDIERTMRSSRFQPEDRTVVQQDINQLRLIEQSHRARRQRLNSYPGT